VWAGVDYAWEQEKLESRKMLACTVPQAQVKMRQNPTRPLHALLGGGLFDNVSTCRVKLI
jgi:hypothetical protein